MIRIVLSKPFKKLHLKYTKNNKLKILAVERTLRRFVGNPFHPSLNTEKLANTSIWSMRINKSDRILFMWINEKTAMLLDIGSHDMYRKI